MYTGFLMPGHTVSPHRYIHHMCHCIRLPKRFSAWHRLNPDISTDGLCLPDICKIPAGLLSASGSIPLDNAVLGFYGNEHHSLPFADFRRLAAKKALASSRNSFSSSRRRISFSCSLFCLRSICTSSARVMAV